jgi:hypothetical protein
MATLQNTNQPNCRISEAKAGKKKKKKRVRTKKSWRRLRERDQS